MRNLSVWVNSFVEFITIISQFSKSSKTNDNFDSTALKTIFSVHYFCSFETFLLSDYFQPAQIHHNTIYMEISKLVKPSVCRQPALISISSLNVRLICHKPLLLFLIDSPLFSSNSLNKYHRTVTRIFFVPWQIYDWVSL